jgi:Raf kinase inhibitor-like YbhB/YbcL family protein
MIETPKLTVTSNTFQDRDALPFSAAHQSAGGENLSPDLTWSAVPPKTKCIAVTCYDPDAPTTVGFVHWVLFNLDPAITSLPAGAGAEGNTPAGAVNGITDFGENHYGGMSPPQGDDPHRYEFRVFALDQKLAPNERTTYAKLRFAIRGHVLAEGLITGLFGLPR